MGGRENRQAVGSFFQLKVNSVMDQVALSGSRGKWLDSGFMWKVEPIGFVDGLDVG